MKDRVSKILIWKGLLISIILFSLTNNIFSIVEIRTGYERSSYMIGNSFYYTPKNIELYNYKVIFNNINNEKMGIEVTSYFKEYDDNALNFEIDKSLEPFIKNKKIYAELNDYFSKIFSPQDTMLQRAFKIYLWINTNIQYEISHDKTQTALSVFQKRRGDCLGYSMLMVYLLRKSKIPAKLFFAYLYDKKNNPAFRGLSSDIYHSVIALYHPKYGWIAMEPQKMFLNITSKHILLFPEERMPNPKVEYYEDAGNKKFFNKNDENSFYANIFLDKFIAYIKNAQYNYQKAYRIVGVAALLKDKGISSPNNIIKKYEMIPVIFPSSQDVNKFYIYNIKLQQIITLEFMERGNILRLSGADGKSFYTLKSSSGSEVFGLNDGKYSVYYLRRGLPFAFYSLDINEHIPTIKEININYILEKGNFGKVVIDFNNGSYMEIPHKNPGFAFLAPLILDNSPIYIDFARDYFYIFGMKKGNYSVKFYNANGKQVKSIEFKNNENR